MRIPLLALVWLAAAGCVAFRYSPPLDETLTEDGARFLETRSVVIPLPIAPGDALDESAAHAVDDPDGTLTILRNRRASWLGRGLHCFEPLLFVLSLGVIPTHCVNDYTFEATLESDAGVIQLRQEYSVTAVQGWFAGVLVLLPAWELLGFGERPAQRALNTVVNRIATTSPSEAVP